MDLVPELFNEQDQRLIIFFSPCYQIFLLLLGLIFSSKIFFIILRVFFISWWKIGYTNCLNWNSYIIWNFLPNLKTFFGVFYRILWLVWQQFSGEMSMFTSGFLFVFINQKIKFHALVSSPAARHVWSLISIGNYIGTISSFTDWWNIFVQLEIILISRGWHWCCVEFCKSVTMCFGKVRILQQLYCFNWSWIFIVNGKR